MMLNPSPGEVTTAETDTMIFVECLIIIAILSRRVPEDRFRNRLWFSIIVLLAFSSLLGAITHGLVISDSFRNGLWKPLYLCLGFVVGLFVVGAVYDWHGRAVAIRLLPWIIGAALVFYGLTEVFKGAFLVFLLYEITGMIAALLIYLFLAVKRKIVGAGVMAIAILMTLLASLVQASGISLTLLVYFDRNGLFHLVQIVALVVLATGLRMIEGAV
jgi:hypothetical protein